MTKITTFLQYPKNDILIVILNVVKDRLEKYLPYRFLTALRLFSSSLHGTPLRAGIYKEVSLQTVALPMLRTLVHYVQNSTGLETIFGGGCGGHALGVSRPRKRNYMVCAP